MMYMAALRYAEVHWVHRAAEPKTQQLLLLLLLLSLLYYDGVDQ